MQQVMEETSVIVRRVRNGWVVEVHGGNPLGMPDAFDEHQPKPGTYIFDDEDVMQAFLGDVVGDTRVAEARAAF